MIRLLRKYGFLKFFSLLRDLWVTLDSDFYVMQARLPRLGIIVKLHFIIYGIHKRFSPNPHFISEDLSKRFPTGSLSHRYPYLKYLLSANGMNPQIAFDYTYRRIYQDTKIFKRSLLAHFYTYGKSEGRLLSKSQNNSEEIVNLWFQHPISPITKVNLQISSCKNIIIGKDDLVKADRETKEHTLQIEKHQHEPFLKISGISVQSVCNHENVQISIILHDDVYIFVDHLINFISRIKGIYQKESEFNSEITRYLLLIGADKGSLYRSSELVFNSRPSFEEKNQTTRYVRKIFPKIQKVWFLSHEDSLSGAPRYLSQLRDQFLTNGFETKLIALSNANQGFRDETNSLRFDLKLYEENRLNPKLESYVASKSNKNSLEERILSLIEMELPDLVVINTIKIASLSKLFTRMGIVNVILIHENNGFSGRTKSSLVGEEIEVLESFQSANLVVFGSESALNRWYVDDVLFESKTLQSIQVSSVTKLDTSSNTKKEKRRTLGFSPDKFTFLAIGNFEFRKRILDIITAFKILSRPDSQLVIVGEWSTTDEYNKKVKNEASGSPDIFLFKSQPNLYDFYLSADAFVLASELETFPLVLQEAASFGIPRIVAKFPGYEESLGNIESALCFSVGDTKELSSRMREIIDINGLAETLTVAANQITATRVEHGKKTPFEILKGAQYSTVTRCR